jgi:hypothetical protein
MLFSPFISAGGSLMKIERVSVMGLAFAVMACLAAAFAGWLSPASAQPQDPGGALRALQGAPSAAPTQRTMSGEWSGKYVCGQGVTGVQMIFSEDGSRALFHSYALPENPGVPEGCFTLSGFFDPASGILNLTAGKWIVRPRNYVTVNVSGNLDASGQNFAGRIIGPSNCSNIVLSHAPSPQPLPNACERALP